MRCTLFDSAFIEGKNILTGLGIVDASRESEFRIGLKANFAVLCTTALIFLDLVSKTSIPTLAALQWPAINFPSALNYLVALMVLISFSWIWADVRFHKYLLLVIALNFVNMFMGINAQPYFNLINLQFILTGVLFYSVYVKYDAVGIERVMFFIIISSYVHMGYLYVTSGIPGPNTHIGSWLYQGIEYGITKLMLLLFSSMSLFWLIIKNRKLHLAIFIVAFAPLFLVTRMGTVAIALVVILHVLNQKKNRGYISFFLCWALLIALVGAYAWVGKFDRMPSYAIGMNLLVETVWGVGHRQYSSYIVENFEWLNITHQHLMGPFINEVFIGAESTYADLLATHGVVGIVLSLLFNYVLLKLLIKYNQMQLAERWFVLVWAFFVFSGVAQDFTNTNVFFYVIFGVCVALIQKYKHRSVANRVI